MIFKKGNKKILAGILGIVFFVLGLWLTQAPKTEAADYNYLHIKLDTETGGIGTPRDGSCGAPENCAQLWQFHGFNSLGHDGLASATTPAGYQCPIWLVEETYGLDDGGAVLWTKSGNRLQKGGTSINSDLTDKAYTACANTNVAPGWYCNTIDADGLKNFTYGLMDNRGDSEDISLSDSVATTYRPNTDILCAGANLWKTCESNSCASVVTPNDRACNGTTKVWSPCTLPQSCNSATGACEAAPSPNALNLNISTSDPYNTVNVGGTLTVTFTVKKTSDSSAVSGASVEVTSLTCTSGTGSLPSPSGNTNSSGQITSTFTAPSSGGTCTINAKATKTGFTEGISTASISITNCASPRYARYDDTYRYVKGKSVKLWGMNPNTNNDFSLCIYDQPGNKKKDGNVNAALPPSGFPQSITYISDSVGAWKGLAIPGQGQCPSPFNGSLGCVASTDVVECLDNSDCTPATCNLSTYTCVAAATPVCSSTNCSAAINNAPCQCGTLTTAAADMGKYCCAGNSLVYGSPSLCQVGACAAGGGGIPCGNGVKDAGEVCDINGNVGCSGATPICQAGCGACIAGGGVPGGLTNPLECEDFVCLIEQIINFLFYLALPIAILMIVIAAFLFMTAGGEPQKINSAKNVILYTLIGLLIITFARGLVSAIKYVLSVK